MPGNENYLETTDTLDIEVGPATPTLAWDARTHTVTYTGIEADIPNLTVTLQNGEVFTDADSISYSYRASGGTVEDYTSGLPVDAGVYLVKASIPAKGNYAAAETTSDLELTIEQSTPSLSINSTNGKTYDG